MNGRFIFSAVTLVWLLSLRAVIAEKPQPPVAVIEPVRFEAHGDVRIDNYFWMRNRGDSKVLDYLKAENAYTDAIMAETKPLEEKLYRETIGRIKQDDSSVPYLENGYEYYRRFERDQQYPLYCRRLSKRGAAEAVMIDVNELAAGHTFCVVPGVEVNSETTWRPSRSTRWGETFSRCDSRTFPAE